MDEAEAEADVSLPVWVEPNLLTEKRRVIHQTGRLENLATEVDIC